MMRYGLWIVFFLHYGFLPAQTTHAVALPVKYNFRNIDNSNGLNSNDVYALTQDRNGYIWIGTDKGLQRYDGLRFMDCLKDSTKIGSQKVYSVYSDDDRGRILYDQPDRRLWEWNFSSHQSVEANTGEPKDLPSVTIPDWRGKTWIIKEYWTDRLGHDADRKGIAFVKESGGRPFRHASFIKDTVLHQLWLVDTANGLLLFNEPGFDRSGIKDEHLLSQLKSIAPHIHKIVFDRYENIWLISWSGNFYRLDRRNQKLFSYSLPAVLEQQGNGSNVPCWVSDILADSRGALWLATAKAGLLQYDYDKDEFRYILRQPGNSAALQYNHQINVIFQDREENIWLGTDRGICIFNPYIQYFNAFSIQHTGNLSMAINEISTAALTGQNELWVGSWGGGLTVYDSVFHFKKHLFFKGSIDQNEIWSLVIQDNGILWAGCQSGYLHVIDLNSGLVRTLRPPETENSTIKSMVRDKQGNTLLGLQNGKVIFFDRKKEEFEPYQMAAQPSAVQLSPVETLYIHEDGSCWAGTRQGMGEYNINKRCFESVYHPFPGSDVRCWGINRYDDSLMIVATEDYGIFLFNRRTKNFNKIQVNEDRPHWSAYAVDRDSAGKIWFNTDYSIGNYDPKNNRSFICQPEQGLITSSFEGCSLLHSGTGKWITWTSAEIVAFHPDQIDAFSKTEAPVSITGFDVYSNPRFIDSQIIHHLPVELRYNENFIAIEFSNLQFSDIARPKYFYQLEGVDRDWVYGGTRGYAGYTNLAPGKYSFHVRSDNGENSSITSLSIHISAPFWATLWFKILTGLLVAVIIIFLIHWYNRGLRKEAEMKQQIATTEMMALRAQMNPHFIFNCINSIDALIQSNDKYNATVYLNKFARLIRNILDSSKQNTISLMRDLETLQLYIDMELFRNENRFTAVIEVEDNLSEQDIRVPPLIIQPYVENAILHGLRPRKTGGGKLLIKVSTQADRLVFVIEDNGVGRSAGGSHSLHRSYGMEMSRDRVNFFNREEHIPVIITDLVKHGVPAGTLVQVSLKLS